MATSAVSTHVKGDAPALPGYDGRWWAFLFIAVAVLAISVDNTILNVALPSISRSLSATSSQLQWIVDGYSLTFAALLLTMGTLSDRFGRKRTLQAGLVTFSIGSVFAALASSPLQLIMARMLIGVGGAMILPSTLSLISASFPQEEKAKAFALWAATFGLGVGIGPSLGGGLIEIFDTWEPVFIAILPIVAIALVGGAYYITESKDETAPPIDIPGVLLSIAGFFSLIYAIIEAGERGWTDSHVLMAFGAAAVFLSAFAWWENRAEHPMLPLRFFRNMSFTGANFTLALVFFALFGSVFFLGQYLQTVLGFNPLEAGVRIIPVAVALTIASIISEPLAARIGTKFTVALGSLLAGGALLYFAAITEVDTAFGLIALGQVMLGVGLGLTVSPSTNSIMQSVPVSKAGVGSALNDTMREFGGALGVAVLGSVLNGIYRNGVAVLPQEMAQLPAQAIAAINSSIQGAHIAAANAPEFAAPRILEVANQSFVNGAVEALAVAGVLMFFASVVALVLLPTRVRRAEEDAQQSESLPIRASQEIDVLIVSPGMGD